MYPLTFYSLRELIAVKSSKNTTVDKTLGLLIIWRQNNL